MIVIVTTISVYLWVYKGVPMDLGTEDDEPDKPTLLKRLIARARARTASRRRAAPPVRSGAIAPPVITRRRRLGGQRCLRLHRLRQRAEIVGLTGAGDRQLAPSPSRRVVQIGSPSPGS